MEGNSSVKKFEAAVKACEKYGFQCHETATGLFIRTRSIAGWMILEEDGTYKLFHENYRRIHSYGQGTMERYHQHEVKETTPEGMVLYILAHDKKMFKFKRKEKVL